MNLRNALVFFLLLFGIFAKAQIGVCVYPFNNTLGFRSTFERQASFEVRSGFYFTHDTAGSRAKIDPHLILSYRLASAGPVSLRLGFAFGLNINAPADNSFFMGLPLTMAMYPIKDNEHFALTAEVGGYSGFYHHQQELYLRGLFGFHFFIYNNLKHDPERRG
jgi:hypothetical protein